MVYAEDDRPKTTDKQVYRSPLTERQLSIGVQVRAKGSTGVSPDEALDPVTVWVWHQIGLDETFGGLANGVEEERTVWSSREGDTPVAAATIHLTIKYRTSRLDPTSTS
jgi:hypothetical protein